MQYSSISFTMKPLYVKEGSTPLGEWTLRRFQEEVADALDSKNDALVVAPTGSGKTLSLLLGEYGAVGLYPNNTLLLDQRKSLDRILRKALNAKPIYNEKENGFDILTIYELDHNRGKLIQSNSNKVAIVMLSGRYIGYDRDENGILVPKRYHVLEDIVKKICYNTDSPYIITLTTPDTALLIMAGMYRDFEKVGYTVHNAILSALEGLPIDFVLSKEMVATSSGDLADIGQIRQCLLKYPWFIDEYHLYGAYESYGVIPILKVYRDYGGWEEPLLLSSATPKGAVYERIKDLYKLRTITATTSDSGDSTTLVRGKTEVEVVHVYIEGRGKWFKVGDQVPDITEWKINEIKSVIEQGGKAFIVTDRINQVPTIVDVLVNAGLQPECGVSIPPPQCSNKEENLLVGSESISQGIDRENVRYGIITGFSWATLIHRFGRIGRKTDSKIVIVTPLTKNKILSSLSNRNVTYDEFVEAVIKDFPNIDMELPQTKGIKDVLSVREKLLEYASTIAFGQVSKPKGTLDALSKLIAENENPLDRFFGSPESIANLMMFRGSGFEVYVKCISCPKQSFISDISSVLRNYIVKKVEPFTYRTRKGIKKRLPKLLIDYTPGRQILVLEPPPTSKERVWDQLAGTITTIGELMNLGFKLYIVPADGSEENRLEVPPVDSVKDQLIGLVGTSEEIADYLTYTLNAALIKRGEAKTLIALLL